MFKKGDNVSVKRGVRLWTTHPSRDGWYPNGRTRTITVHHRVSGWSLPRHEVLNTPTYMEMAEAILGAERLLEIMDDDEIDMIPVHHSRVVWQGTGGYWVEAEECNVELID